MRRFILASAAVAALAAASALSANRAEAMTLPSAGLAKPDSAAEQVYVRCTRFWNGYRWVRRCVDVDGGYGYGGGYYYAPRPRYYAPRPYYGPRPWGWY